MDDPQERYAAWLVFSESLFLQYYVAGMRVYWQLWIFYHRPYQQECKEQQMSWPLFQEAKQGLSLVMLRPGSFEKVWEPCKCTILGEELEDNL
jgi:hypothetical protein